MCGVLPASKCALCTFSVGGGQKRATAPLTMVLSCHVCAGN